MYETRLLLYVDELLENLFFNYHSLVLGLFLSFLFLVFFVSPILITNVSFRS